MIARCLVLIAPLALAGCLVVPADAVDAAAIAGPVPGIADGEATGCISAAGTSGLAGDTPECGPVEIGRRMQDGAEWLMVTGGPQEPPAHLLFLEGQGQSLALMRLNLEGGEAVLALMRVRDEADRLVLELPLCGTGMENDPLAAAAAAAGARIEPTACIFADLAGLADTAAGGAADGPAFVITISR